MGLWHLSVPVENITCAPGTQDTIFICHRKERENFLGAQKSSHVEEWDTMQHASHTHKR